MTTVCAQLQYLAESTRTTSESPPIYYASTAGDVKEAEHEGQFEWNTIDIHDGRTKCLSSFTIDREGFQLIPHKNTKVTNFYNDYDIEHIYENEIQQLLLNYIPNAKQIKIFDHTRRTSSAVLRQERNVREPTSLVHNDYTERSARTRLNAIMGGSSSSSTNSSSSSSSKEISQSRQHDDGDRRFAIVNVWRSISSINPIEQAHLAFCDSTTLSYETDLVGVKRIAKDRIGELQLAYYNTNQRWYYFPSMTYDEAVIFKTFDSDPSVNQYTLHTAFTPSDVDITKASPRESIETRCFVFF